jgi:hypothetical protein
VRETNLASVDCLKGEIMRSVKLGAGRPAKRFALLLAVLAFAVTAIAATARAGGPPMQCSGAFTGTTAGNLVVPSGDFCIILGATIGGNVLVSPGAIGFHSHHSTIAGSVLSPGPIVFDVRVLDSTVGHDVSVAQMRAGTAGGICRSTIGGNVILENNAGFMNVGSGFPFDVCPFSTSGNHIGGNLIVDDNSGGNTINNNTVDGSVLVNDNTNFEDSFENVIGHTFECNGNTPPPVGVGNTASNFVGQCTS